MPRPADLPTIEERREATEEARRAMRFNAAKRRIKEIVSAAPKFTDEQLRVLSLLIQQSETR